MTGGWPGRGRGRLNNEGNMEPVNIYGDQLIFGQTQEHNATVPRRKSRDFPQLAIITRGWLIIGLSHERGRQKRAKYLLTV